MLFIFLFAVFFNLLIFLPAFFLKTDKFTDISYSLTFVVIATFLLLRNHDKMNMVSMILYIMICLWALRLGGYLLYRIQKIGRDKRFDSIRGYFFRFMRFWILQGLTVFIILIPSIYLFDRSNSNFIYVSLIGVCIFLFGLIYETIADIQKFKFLSHHAGRKMFMHTGLWSYSRHPNYFGEICVWLGIYIYCAFYLSLNEGIIALISPLFIYILLRYVSGIPLLEKSAEIKFGKMPSYMNYKRNVPMLFPKSGRKDFYD